MIPSPPPESPRPEPLETSAEDRAQDLRLHYTGLAHFFATFEPRPPAQASTAGTSNSGRVVPRNTPSLVEPTSIW